MKYTPNSERPRDPEPESEVPPAAETAASETAPAAVPDPEVAHPLPGGATPPIKRGPGRGQRLLRWVLGLLILLGIGFVAALILFYLPERDRRQSGLAELEAARTTITAQAAQLADTAPLTTQAAAAAQARTQAELRAALLQARTEVLATQLALAQDNPAGAKSALSGTVATFGALEELLPAGQKDLLASLQERLTLAQQELETDTYAAQSDLDVLANGLLALENTLFAR